MALIDQIADIIKRESPRHAKKLASHLGSVGPDFLLRAEEFLERYEALLHRRGRRIDFGVHCYLEMCKQMMNEQIAFVRSGKYSCASFEEVERRVYANPQVMDSYMHGLLLSQFLWKSHYQVLEFFTAVMSREAEGLSSYLEIGPGHGLYLSEALKLLAPAARVTALDISPASLDLTRELVGDGRVRYIAENFVTCSFDEPYDFIVLGEVIEHVENPLQILEKVRSQLSPRGMAFISAPANAPAIDHIYLFSSPQDIRDLVTSAGFEVVEETSCCTENASVEVAIQQKLPIMYAALVRPS